MSSTAATTSTSTVKESMLIRLTGAQYLDDYEIHHSPVSVAPRTIISDDYGTLPATLPQESSSACPDWWPRDHRRVPPHRPIQRDLDFTTRPAGSHWGETIFILTMLGGVNINAISHWRREIENVGDVGPVLEKVNGNIVLPRTSADHSPDRPFSPLLTFCDSAVEFVHGQVTVAVRQACSSDPSTLSTRQFVGMAAQPSSPSMASGENAGDATSVSNNPFSCTICHRRYSRIDHLARHHRSHTQERPFACQECHKRFARIDLLKRHSATHTDRPPSAKRSRVDGTPPSRRNRASRACVACAEAKGRCEGQIPCLRCRQKNITCELQSSRHDRDYEDSSLGLSTIEPTAMNQREMQSTTSIAPSADLDTLLIDYAESIPANSGSANVDRVLNEDGIDASANHIIITPSSFDIAQANHTDGIASSCTTTHDDASALFLADESPYLDFDRLFDTSLDIPLPMDVLDFGMDSLAPPVDYVGDALAIYGGEQNLNAALIYSRIGGGNAGDETPNLSGVVSPGGNGNFNIGISARAFRESVWLWTPASINHAGEEQSNLALDAENISLEGYGSMDQPALQEQINPITRGRMLAMVLKTCEPLIYPHVVSSFPRPDLLGIIIRNFLGFHMNQEMTWIHPATIELNKESPEFLTALAASGAALSHIPEIRKLGFAMQEAVRIGLEQRFELDNSQTRELRPLQTFALNLDIGLWSGLRRKMEIAESFAMPLITMMRRAGQFRRSRVPELAPQAEDIGAVLEMRWRKWVERESRIRLALYMFSRDARSSMSLLSQPLISHAEVGADLPSPKDLWNAKSALEWKALYLSNSPGSIERPHPFRQCLHDSTLIYSQQATVDTDMAVLAIIAAAWGLVWHYREMKTVARSQGESSLALSARHQEALQTLEHLKLTVGEWKGQLAATARLMHEQCLMHLYVSLEDVQLLAGKEGETESRAIHASLVQWAKTPEARRAVSHAGQVIRAASEATDMPFDGPSAVAVYHASLVCWAYAVLAQRSSAIRRTANVINGPREDTSSMPVRLDGPGGADLQRFLVLGKGTPCIGLRADEDADAFGAGPGDIAPLNKPWEVMRSIITLLKSKSPPREGSMSPLLENLVGLMQALGKAASTSRRHVQ